jgi:excisionase family DNA binding protein
MQVPSSARSFTVPAAPESTAPELPLVVTVTEATRLLSVGRTTLYKLMNDRDLTAIKIGGATRILRSSLDEYVKTAVV